MSELSSNSRTSTSQAIDSDDQSRHIPRSASIQSAKICIAFLVFVSILLGVYCCQLNLKLYQHQHPIFDSLSYNEKLSEIMTTASHQGIMPALNKACFSNQTNCLPFIIGAVAGLFTSPSRLVGIWIQTFFLTAFLLSLFYYLVQIQRLKPWTAALGCCLFVGCKCLYLPNGGLSDFRMDLGLFLSFSITCVWYLISCAQPTWRNFVLLGFAAAGCCLCRATAPVYLLVALLPVCLSQLCTSNQRVKHLSGLAIAILIVIVFAGWFYFLNFEYLKYYYVDWNTDANAKLPWREATQHWGFATRSIGDPILILLTCWTLAMLCALLRPAAIGNWLKTAVRQRELDWRIGWIGISPIAMLVARRAGLNPFVCMPAVFGLVLFLSLPLLKQMERSNGKWNPKLPWILLAVVIGLVGISGWKRHSASGVNTMDGQKHLIQVMVSDAKKHEQEELRFDVLHIGHLNVHSLHSILLFDEPQAEQTPDGIQMEGILVSRSRTFFRPAVFDWSRIKGDTDDSKITYLIHEANQRVDYLIVPSQTTVQSVATMFPNSVINRHVPIIRQRIVSDKRWVQILGPTQISEAESVEIYRRIE